MVARVQMLVGKVERGSGHRQREHRGQQGDTRPLRAAFRKQPLRDAPGGPENCIKRKKLP